MIGKSHYPFPRSSVVGLETGSQSRDRLETFFCSLRLGLALSKSLVSEGEVSVLGGLASRSRSHPIKVSVSEGDISASDGSVSVSVSACKCLGLGRLCLGLGLPLGRAGLGLGLGLETFRSRLQHCQGVMYTNNRKEVHTLPLPEWIQQ